MRPVKQVWLEKRVTVNQRGNFVFAGDCGTERIRVEIDPTITASELPAEAEAAVLAMHSRIQKAARHKHSLGEAYAVRPSGLARLQYSLIALTDLDLIEA